MHAPKSVQWFNQGIRDNLPADAREMYGGVEYFRYVAVHEFLLSRDGTDEELLLGGAKGPELERLRKITADLKEIDLMERRGKVIDSKELAPLFARYGQALRRGADAIKRRFGNDALELFNDTLDDLEKITDDLNVSNEQQRAHRPGEGDDQDGPGPAAPRPS